MSNGTLRTASIIASQLQEHNGGLFEDVDGAELLAEPDMWAGFFVTDNDGRRFRVLVTPAEGAPWAPPEGTA